MSAAVGAAGTSATTAVLRSIPRDPTFQLISVSVATFNFHLPLLDADLLLTFHVINPNVVPIRCGPSLVSIFYDGSLLGTAKLEPLNQKPKSCRLVALRAHLDSVVLGHHAVKFLADVARREMVLEAEVTVHGEAKVAWWVHRFSSDAKGAMAVDPALLNLIEQDNHLGLGW